MAAPTITNGVVSGGSAVLTGTNLTFNTVNYTQKKTFTPTDTPGTELKNGATLVENAVMGGGVSLVRASSQYVEMGSGWYMDNGSTSYGCWLNLATLASNPIFIRTSTIGDHIPHDIYVQITGGSKLRVFLYNAYGTPVRKLIEFDSSGWSLSTNYHIGFVWDNSSSSNVPQMYINGSFASTTTIFNDSFTSLQGFSYSTDGTDLYTPAQSYMDGTKSLEMIYSGIWSGTDFANIYNNTQYYYKVAGAGALIPITPTSSSSTSATLSEPSAGDTVYVFNKDGSASFVITASSEKLGTIKQFYSF